jgi:hypothetical protein
MTTRQKTRSTGVLHFTAIQTIIINNILGTDMKSNLTILTLLFFFGINISPAQEDSTSSSSKSRIRERVDEIVHGVFKQVERELGTTIYDEDIDDIEEENRSDEEIINNEDSIDSSESDEERFDSKPHKMERLSLYAFPIDRGIPRNFSAKLPMENIDDHFLFRYNRVEGLFLGFQSPHKFYWDEGRKFGLFGSLGYGFGEHRWRGNIGATQQFGVENHLFEIGIEGHRLADTRDQWLVGNLENTLSAMFARFDYRNYYGRKGFSSWIGFYTRKHYGDMQFKATYFNDNYDTLSNNVHWSLFRTKKSFRDNPPVSVGNLRSLILTFDLHKLNSYKQEGWSVSLSAEFAGKAFKGAYDFNRYVLDLRRYQPISKYDNVNLRLRVATSEGDIPAQRAFEIGGISTLPAYSYKNFAGNRMLLGNIEYIVNGSMFENDTDFPLSIFDHVNLILFADAGYVTQVPGSRSFVKGFDKLKHDVVKSDWGFGTYRLGFAWRTDIKSAPCVFIRMSRPF